MGLFKHMNDMDEFEFEPVNLEDNSTKSENMNTRSGQMLSTEVIDITIEDAKNKKETFNSTMVSLLSFLKEVEHREKLAEDAIDKANRTSPYILGMMEVIDQAKQRAKEANKKKAQEVYAQKMALATAMKELQIRVSGVLNEEVESLQDLDKMCISLEKRLTSALEKKKAVEKEQLERLIALEYEQNVMQKIDEESKRLEHEAMENLKMQEFIISRGHVVDILEEDISCRWHDMNMLKLEKLVDCKDENEILDIVAKMDDPKHTDQQSAKVAKMDETKPTENGNKDIVENYLCLTPIIQETISGWAEKESIANLVESRARKICKKENKNIKRSETKSKNKVMKKWIDGLIKEAVAEYKDDDFDRYECLYG